MTVEGEEDLQNLKEIGRIVALTLQKMAASVQAGLTTAELDEVGRTFMQQQGARPAPPLVYKFPGATCISINHEAAHGIPGRRRIQAGDLVNIDVSAEKNGYFADAALTIPVPPVNDLRQKLVDCAKKALETAIQAARSGQPINVIGKAVEEVANRNGFTVIRDLTGHGVGRSIHEDPRAILNYYNPGDRRRLSKGMVITIEPFLSNGATRVNTRPDGWTLVTPDKQLSAQFEHTIVVTAGQPVILTAI